MPSPIEILRARNAANGPAKLSTGQKGGLVASTIALALAAIYTAEGGYVNDPADRGGATNYGITEKVARENGYLGNMRNFPKHCAADVSTCADRIYTKRYMEEPGFVPLILIEPAVFKEVVDTGVNMGPGKAAIYLQASINVLCGANLPTDGKVGPGTIAAYRSCQDRVGQEPLCRLMLDALDGAQERRYRAIVKATPSQGRFLRGWLRMRIGNVKRAECVRVGA